MARPFLSLAAGERADILQAVNTNFGPDPVILEKDIWVCWTLHTLFTMPGAHPMAFRGGTALSKVYGVIDRFSEDVDVSFDYRVFSDGFDPFAEGVSRTRIKRLSEQLRARVADYVRDVVAPFVDEAAQRLDMDGRHDIRISEDGESLLFVYPSAVGGASGYFSNEVLLEFGGRNVISPNERRPVAADIAGFTQDLEFPSATVTVLNPKRTFWEKATLAHVACHRRRLAGRLSRHWFDLACLADHEIGRAALDDRALLGEVVKHKKMFFHYGGVSYDRCLEGELRLVPDEDQLPDLKADYEAMCDADAIRGDVLEFDALMERIRLLEANVNGRGLSDDLPESSPFRHTWR